MKKLGLLLMPLLIISLLTNCSSVPKEYVVKFDSNGGSLIVEQRVKENERLVKPDDPTKNGYPFKNWCTNETLTDEFDFSSLVNSNFTLYAKWSDAIIYTITYHMPEGSTQSNPNSYTVESKDITLSNATKNGYEFNGWHIGSATGKLITTIPKGNTGNLDLYTSAVATTYTITYRNLEGSTTDNPTSYTVEDDTITLKNPTDHGYEFTGWHKDSSSGELISSIEKGTTGNLNLYAGWNTIPTTYTITYKNVEPSEHSSDPESYTVETDTITLSTPTRDENWTFNGWYAEPEFKNQIVNISKGSYGDITLYAKMAYNKTLEQCNWDEIKMVSEKGGARATFGEPGSQTKIVTVDDTENQVRILAYDYDELAISTSNDPHYAGITFEFVNTISDFTTCWNTKHGEDSNNQDFILFSNLKECLDEGKDLYKLLPSDLSHAAKRVNKKAEIKGSAWIEKNYVTKLFPLSYDEIDGDDDATYEYYKIDSKNKRIKNNIYWLRSPNKDTRNRAWSIENISGGINSSYVRGKLSVAPAFCV